MSRSPDPLESLQRFGWRFGLSTVRALLARLGDPQRALRAVHVAGTNGKGATCAYLASILRAAGHRCGLYTSPHLSDPRERIRVDGAAIPSSDYARLSGRVLRACRRFPRGRRPTYFEAQTALAFLWFLESRTDVCVIETGLGGRLDATNVLERPLLCLVTPVGLDHRDLLGSTVERIAAEKAGILKRGCLAATLQTDPAALRVLRKAAHRVGAPLAVGGEDFPLRIPIQRRRPAFDAFNASLAAAGARLLRHHGWIVPERAIRRGIRSMRWPGRFETLSERPLVILDGAHNPPASRALEESLRRRFGTRRFVVLNGFLGDKDAGACVRHLTARAQSAVVTAPPSDRARGGGEVFREWERRGVPAVWIRDWRRALTVARIRAGRHGALLVTGSLYLVGAVREALVGRRGLERL